MILVDSSAWVEFLRASGSPADHYLKRAIKTKESLATIGLVLLEILAGAHDERHARDLRRLLDRCQYLPLEEPSDYESAAALYRTCRREGKTVRRLPDCLIASVAIRTGAKLLHQDSDFNLIATHTALKTLTLAHEEG